MTERFFGQAGGRGNQQAECQERNRRALGLRLGQLQDSPNIEQPLQKSNEATGEAGPRVPELWQGARTPAGADVCDRAGPLCAPPRPLRLRRRTEDGGTGGLVETLSLLCTPRSLSLPEQSCVGAARSQRGRATACNPWGAGSGEDKAPPAPVRRCWAPSPSLGHLRRLRLPEDPTLRPQLGADSESQPSPWRPR